MYVADAASDTSFAASITHIAASTMPHAESDTSFAASAIWIATFGRPIAARSVADLSPVPIFTAKGAPSQTMGLHLAAAGGDFAV